MATRRVTLQDVANHLGVSTATVSLALRNSPLVSPVTREEVVKTARSLGYVYNRSAAGLRTARSNTIGVGFHDILNPYFTELLFAIEEATVDTGYTVLLGSYKEDVERQSRVLSTLVEHQPDGLIVCPAGGTTGEHLAPFAANVPLVTVSREVVGTGIDFVGSDDIKGFELSMGHLLELGHRRIALVGGTMTISTGRNRYNTYCRVLREAGIAIDETLIIQDYGTRETGLRGVLQLLDLPKPPTAIACFNDITAFGVLMGLIHRGVRAGIDISVVGCDDVAEAQQWAPPLTTVHNSHPEMGRKASDLLQKRIADPERPAERVLIEPRLIVRGTTGPAPR